MEEATEFLWEDGKIPLSTELYKNETGITVELFESPSSQRKNSRRFSAKEKELAELVHRVHLLCLLGRGRLIDAACNDPLIQASLMSLLPFELIKIGKSAKLTTNVMVPLVKWFQNNFRIQSLRLREGNFQKNLAFALGSQEGTAEEIAALSVALMRALTLPVRFVFALDVLPLKPDIEVSSSSSQDGVKLDTKIPSISTAMSFDVPAPQAVSPSSPKSSQLDTRSRRKITITRGKKASVGSSVAAQTRDENMGMPIDDLCSNLVDINNTTSLRTPRKGDVEFEMQLQMALSATAATNDNKLSSCLKESRHLPEINQPKKMRTANDASSSSSGGTGAVWSRITGPPLYWAEVFCNGENLTGRWVHIDAAAGVIDGEQKVEAAAAACRKPLRYVVAFAGTGAKDVTRRYCTQWYKISPHRVCSEWWDAVLLPLKELEASTTGDLIDSETYKDNSSNDGLGHSKESTRDSLEDLELATRALTEPLPTNQQAYRTHPLYVLERWLTKYQVLHPRGPVLGYCSGHPVYPRGCIQTLHTKQMWLREALQVKENEIPAKVIKRSSKCTEVQVADHDALEDGAATTELYGKWQTEPLCLPVAVDGIVPKNERGQVDVWSEKCLPPGTVHLKMPRSHLVAKRLGVDFAPAMVGFEFRNGRLIPIFEGIVVCTEFKDAVMEAYAEEEERREAEEMRKREAQALSRWYQLLSSIVTRQRLHDSYEAATSFHIPNTPTKTVPENITAGNAIIPGSTSVLPERPSHASLGQDAGSAFASVGDHEHTFPIEDQSFDEESSTRTKRCPCGFSIQVEEL